MANKGNFRHCAIPFCDTFAASALYTIPEHPVKRQARIEACKFTNEPPKRVQICWKHFKKADFKSEIDFENLASCHFPCLHPSAVLSLFLCTAVLSSTENTENDSVLASTEHTVSYKITEF